MERADDGGNGTALPWASVFDPAANIRALSSIQADGLRAASELVDRFVRIAAHGLNGNTSPATSTTADASDARDGDLFGATGLEPVVTAWWSMVDQLLRVSTPRVAGDGEPTSATLELSTSTATGEVRIDATGPGTARAELWLHNGGPLDLDDVRLRCGDLLTHDGLTVAADSLRFEPEVVLLPARSSRGVTLGIDVGDDARPGIYRGVLVADGYPEMWAPIKLVVTA
ncbi:MAG: hypothetical protein ABW001_01590 [Mycobacterium sp.]